MAFVTPLGESVQKRLNALRRGAVAYAESGLIVVGTTSEKIFADRQNRISLGVVCLHASQNIKVWDRTVSSTKGIYLGPNGGIFTLNFANFEDVGLLEREWYAVGSAASTDIFAWEVFIVG